MGIIAARQETVIRALLLTEAGTPLLVFILRRLLQSVVVKASRAPPIVFRRLLPNVLGAVLVLATINVLAMNLLGDWLRDPLNPRLQ